MLKARAIKTLGARKRFYMRGDTFHTRIHAFYSSNTCAKRVVASHIRHIRRFRRCSTRKEFRRHPHSEVSFDWSRRRLRCGSSFAVPEKQSSIFAPSFFPIHLEKARRACVLYIPEQTYPSRSRTRYAKKNKNDTFRTRYAKKKSRVPPQLGGSVFEAAEGLREFRVPGTRFVFCSGGVRDICFFAYP